MAAVTQGFGFKWADYRELRGKKYSESGKGLALTVRKDGEDRNTQHIKASEEPYSTR